MSSLVAPVAARYGNLGPMVPKQLWDRVVCPLKVARHIPTLFCPFSVAIGQPCPFTARLKTLHETNMTRGNQLPPPLAYEATKIAFTFASSCAAADVVNFAETAIFSFRRDDKIHWRAPLIALQTVQPEHAPIRTCSFCRSVFCSAFRCPSCGAPQFTLPGRLSSRAAGTQFFHEVPKSAGVFIAPLQQFSCQIELSDAFNLAGDLDLWVHLEGEGNEHVI